MDNKENEKSLSFTKEDFFNTYEMKQFVEYLSRVDDVDTYMKKAIINRVMIDAQSEDPLYEQLMRSVQKKGIEQIIQLIEKRENTPSLDEKDVERIVLRVLQERQVSNVSIIREEVDMQSTKTPITPLGERRRPSNKLNNL